jgi:hypothetical protein
MDWPLGEGRAPKKSVLYLQTEDGVRDTILPRMIASGADVSKIHLLDTVMEDGKERMFSLLTDLPILLQKIIEIGDVGLLLIDPISAYQGVGKVDSHRNADVRGALGPLVKMIEQQRITCVGIMHFNKKVDVFNTLLRTSDSIAYTALARSVHATVDDPDNHRKLLVCGKNNLAAAADEKTLAYEFVSTTIKDGKTGTAAATSFIRFTEYVDVTATEAMHAASEFKSPGARDRAKTLLRDLLAGGPIAQTDIEEMAKAEDISLRTLKRAKKELRIRSTKQSEGKWMWELPGDDGLKAA